MRPVVMRHKNISGLLIKLLDRKLTGNQGCIYVHVDMGLTIKEVRTAWSNNKTGVYPSETVAFSYANSLMVVKNQPLPILRQGTCKPA